MNIINKLLTLVKNNLLISILIIILLFLSFLLAIINQPKQSDLKPNSSPVPQADVSPFTASPSLSPVNFDNKLILSKDKQIAVKKNFGEKIKEYPQKQFTVMEYQSKIPSYPHKEYLINKQPVLIIEEVAYDEHKFLDQYQNTKNPPLIRYEQNLGNTYPLSVFLDQGLAVASHIKSKRVIQIWHFQPMSEKEFNFLFEQELSRYPFEQF